MHFPGVAVTVHPGLWCAGRVPCHGEKEAFPDVELLSFVRFVFWTWKLYCMKVVEYCRPEAKGFRLGERSQGSHSTAADILLMFQWCAGLAFVCYAYISLSGIPQLEIREVCMCVHVWEHGNKYTFTFTLKLKWFPATLKYCELQLHISP